MNFRKNTSIYRIILMVCSIWIYGNIAAQCGFIPAQGCTNTDYHNTGLYSDNNAATIEYDNFVVGYHQSIVRNEDGTFSIWGEHMGDGTTSQLTPKLVNSTNFPALGSATVLKAALGGLGSAGGSIYSKGGYYDGASGTGYQAVFLTTNGLYTYGGAGSVFRTGIVGGNTFTKLPAIAGSTYSLPPGLLPKDVKVMTATYHTLLIVTCSGDVWVLSQEFNMSQGVTNWGNIWKKIETSAGVSLTNIIAARISAEQCFALKSDGTLWTWGNTTYLGDGSTNASRTYATQMVSPSANPIKMIGATNGTYYVLYANGNLFSLGNGNRAQLGNYTTAKSFVWIQPRYTNASGPVMNDIKWISATGTGAVYTPAINAIAGAGALYAWGANDRFMIGTPDVGFTNLITISNPNFPQGTAAQVITNVTTGGHISMCVKNYCDNNLYYVGHALNGSMGNGSAADVDNTSYTPTILSNICGFTGGAINVTAVNPQIDPSTGKYCVGTSPTLQGTPNGGTFSVFSGPGNITSGNTLNFTGVGDVEVRYSLTTPCVAYVSRIFSTINCCTSYTYANNMLNTTPLCLPSVATITGSTPTITPVASPLYRWQMSTTSTTTGFTDISGAINKDYTVSSISQPTYFRRIVYAISSCKEDTSASITVTPSNSPITNHEQYKVFKGQTLSGGNVISNDSDPNGDPITVTLVNNVSIGTLTLNSNGTFTYVADANFTGIVHFDYNVCDNKGCCNNATATLTIEDPCCITGP